MKKNNKVQVKKNKIFVGTDVHKTKYAVSICAQGYLIKKYFTDAIPEKLAQ